MNFVTEMFGKYKDQMQKEEKSTASSDPQIGDPSIVYIPRNQHQIMTTAPLPPEWRGRGEQFMRKACAVSFAVIRPEFRALLRREMFQTREGAEQYFGT